MPVLAYLEKLHQEQKLQELYEQHLDQKRTADELAEALQKLSI